MNTESPKRVCALFALAAEEYREHLQRYLVRRVRSADDAKDLAQEVYLRLLRVQDSGYVKEPLAYLYRTASNVVYEFMRARRLPVIFDSDAADSAAKNGQGQRPDELAEHLSQEREVEDILANLPPLQRAILVLRKRDGLSYTEIARQLDISVHTVNKYLVKALATLRSTQWNPR